MCIKRVSDEDVGDYDLLKNSLLNEEIQTD